MPMSRRAVFLLLFACSPFVWSRGSVPGEAEVLAADERRVAAMVANDAQAVAALLSDGLNYGHSDGRVQTKGELLVALTANSMQYRAYNYQQREVQALGSARGVTGVAKVQVVVAGSTLEFTIRFLAVYVQEGGTWRLAAYQSAQILPPKT